MLSIKQLSPSRGSGSSVDGPGVRDWMSCAVAGERLGREGGPKRGKKEASKTTQHGRGHVPVEQPKLSATLRRVPVQLIMHNVRKITYILLERQYISIAVCTSDLFQLPF
jgi:hypothetical protein